MRSASAVRCVAARPPRSGRVFLRDVGARVRDRGRARDERQSEKDTAQSSMPSYARPADRQAIERVAADMSVPFVGIWLEAPEATLIARTEQRRNDPSDADADVIRLQHRQRDRRDDVAPRRSLCVTRDCAGDAAKYVQQQVPGALNSQGVGAKVS